MASHVSFNRTAISYESKEDSMSGFQLTQVPPKVYDNVHDILIKSSRLGRKDEMGFRLTPDRKRIVLREGYSELEFNKLENGRVIVRYPNKMTRQRLMDLVERMYEVC